MRASIAESRTLLTVPSTDVKRLVQQDPLGFSRLLRERLSAGPSLPADPTQEGLVSRDGRRRLVVIEPKEPPFDTAFSHRLLAALAAAETDTRAARPVSDETEDPTLPRVAYAGGYRVAVETEALVRRETIRNTTQSLVAVLILLAVGLRSARLVLYGAIPIALASILVLAAAAAGNVKLSAAASGSSAMLFGLGVDAVILLFLRFREEESAGTPRASAIINLHEPAASVVMGVVTTAATFLALLLMDFPTLQEPVRSWAPACSFAAPSTIVIVPALLSSLPPAPESGVGQPPRGLQAGALGRLVASWPRAILAGALLLTLVLAPGVGRVRLAATLDKLRPTTGANTTEAAIAAHFGVTQDVHLVVAEGPDLESLLEDQRRFAERLRADAPGVALQSPTALLPPSSVQAARARRIAEAALDLSRARADLGRASEAAGFRPGAFAPFDERLAHVLDTTQRLTFEGYRQNGLDDVLAPLVRATPGGYNTVAYAFPTNTAETKAVMRAVTASGGALVVTGTPVVNRELEARFWPQFRLAAVIGGVAVIALIAIAFRSAEATLFALLPTAIGLVWALGTIGFAGLDSISSACSAC